MNGAAMKINILNYPDRRRATVWVFLCPPAGLLTGLAFMAARLAGGLFI